ncbi:MAG: DUF4239 domain-containing protein [Candidatus Solibacter sp.]
MVTPYEFILAALFIFATTFAATLALLRVGRRIGIRKRASDPEGAVGLGAIEGAVYGVMGLLLAFTFSGAAARFDVRRQLIVRETNAIGTAYLRLDLLPPDYPAKLRDDFRNYVDARLSLNRTRLEGVAKTEMSAATAFQGQIWKQAVAACKEANSPAVTSLVLSSLNEMIDVTTMRTAASQTHPPLVVYLMLLTLLFTSSLLAGYGSSGGISPSWLHMLGYASIMAISVYVILDIEFPRVGFVRVDYVDQLLRDLRDSMR